MSKPNPDSGGETMTHTQNEVRKFLDANYVQYTTIKILKAALISTVALGFLCLIIRWTAFPVPLVFILCLLAEIRDRQDPLDKAMARVKFHARSWELLQQGDGVVAQRTFRTTELLEMILVRIRLRDVENFQRVSNRFKDTVDCSIQLNHKLGRAALRGKSH